MAAFRCQARQSEVSEAVRKSLSQHGLNLVWQSPNVFFSTWKGKWSVEHEAIFTITPSGEDGDTSRLDIESSLSLRFSLSFLGSVLFAYSLILIGVFLLPHFTTWSIVLVTGGGLLWLFDLLISNLVRRQANTMLASIVDTLRPLLKTQQTTPLGLPKLKMSDGTVVWSVLVPGLIVILVYRSMGFFPFLICSIPLVALVAQVLAGRPHESWRNPLSTIQAAWTGWSSEVMLPALIMIYCCAVEHSVPNPSEYPSASDFMKAILTEADHTVLQNLSEPSHMASAQQGAIAGHIAARLDAQFPEAANLWRYGTFLTITGMVVVYVIFRTWSLIQSCEHWTLSLARARTTGFTLVLPAADSSRPSLSATVGSWTSFLCHGLLHWVSAVLAVIITVYLLTGRCLLAPYLGVAFDVFGYNAQVTLGAVIGTIVSRVVLLLLAVPGTISLAIAVRRVYALLKKELAFLKLKYAKAASLASSALFIEMLAGRLNQPVPFVEVRSLSKALIYSDASMLGFGSRIVVSGQLAKQLSEQEMNGLLAHEAHHLANDIQILNRLRLLSTVFLYPFHYAIVFYDFPTREREADAFASTVLGDAQPLIAALTKLSVWGLTRRGSPPADTHRHDFAKSVHEGGRFRNVISLFFDDLLLGAAYPFLQDRLAALRHSIRTEDLEETAGATCAAK